MDIDDEMTFEEVNDDMLKISSDSWEDTTMSFDDDDVLSEPLTMDDDEQEAQKLALYTLIFDQFLDSRDSDDDMDDTGDTDLIATIIKLANEDDTTGQEAMVTEEAMPSHYNQTPRG